MNNSILVAIIATIASTNLIAAEPSAFGAGNLDNPTPYGLSSNEKTVLENKSNLQRVVTKTNNQAGEVDSLRERIDGLQSIIESLSKKAQSNKTELNEFTQKNFEALKNSDEFDKRLSDISQSNSEDIAKIKVAISELSKLIESTSKSCVTKDELDALLSEQTSKKSKSKSESEKSSKSEKADKSINQEKSSSLEKSVKSEKSSLEKMSHEDIDTKAKAFYDKKDYTQSTEYYSYLIDKNYKPAVAHYMIGEMNFNKKNYSEAVAYFKKSASLYSKASYMQTLLLHTAISMSKSNDKKNAKAFYEALISGYPDTPEAKEAKKNLSSLK
jgi:TolA-binding protein